MELLFLLPLGLICGCPADLLGDGALVHDGGLAPAVSEHAHHVHQQRAPAPTLLALSCAVQADVDSVVHLDTGARHEGELEDGRVTGEGGGVHYVTPLQGSRVHVSSGSGEELSLCISTHY